MGMLRPALADLQGQVHMHSSSMNRGHLDQGRSLGCRGTSVILCRPCCCPLCHPVVPPACLSPYAPPLTMFCANRALLALDHWCCYLHRSSIWLTGADTPDVTFATTLDLCKSAVPVQHQCRIALWIEFWHWRCYYVIQQRGKWPVVGQSFLKIMVLLNNQANLGALGKAVMVHLNSVWPCFDHTVT